jgi:hypothetical protein
MLMLNKGVLASSPQLLNLGEISFENSVLVVESDFILRRDAV